MAMAHILNRPPPSSEDAEKYGVSLEVLRFQPLVSPTGSAKTYVHPWPNLNTCLTCWSRQPIFKTCTKCYALRNFKCFSTACFNLDDWDDWEHYSCRYCREDVSVVGTIADPPPGKEAEHLAWLQQEKVKLYRAKAEEYKQRDDPDDTVECQRCLVKTKQKRRSCFHCGQEVQHQCNKFECFTEVYDKRMNGDWFCNDCNRQYRIVYENLENYCFLCRTPMPISGNCKNCGEFYRFHCLYPPKCISTLYSKEVGMDRWDHCPKCLSEKDLEIVDKKMRDEAEKEQMDLDIQNETEEGLQVLDMDISA